MHRYLAGHAESEVDLVAEWPRDVRFEQVVVVPAFREADPFLHRLPRGQNLLIIVINQGPEAAPQVADNNHALARQIRARLTSIDANFAAGNLELLRHNELGYHCLMVDRFSPGWELPPRTGVGLARKIGADLAAALIDRGLVASPWIHNTDADTHLPEDYFHRSRSFQGRASALLYPFTHIDVDDDPLARATKLYEFGLRHYEHGLRQAGSPYAFQTVGSAFAVHAMSYAQVRGFPKREAAEDFYMLNKLRKVGPVVELSGDPIRIESRTSDRVPFGTGAGVVKILALDDALRHYRFYHPQSFHYLAYWLSRISSQRDLATTGDALFADITDRCPASLDPGVLAAALEATGMKKGLVHALRQSREPAQFEKHMHDAFDAFRTRKLIHYIRDHAMPEITLSQLLRVPGYRDQLANDPAMVNLLKQLQAFSAAAGR